MLASGSAACSYIHSAVADNSKLDTVRSHPRRTRLCNDNYADSSTDGCMLVPLANWPALHSVLVCALCYAVPHFGAAIWVLQQPGPQFLGSQFAGSHVVSSLLTTLWSKDQIENNKNTQKTKLAY